MDKYDSVFPLEVYRRVSDEGVALADGHLIGDEMIGGTVLPPFTRATAEAIASTKPSWAALPDTDIGPETRVDDHDHLYITWVRSFGTRVAVVQEHVYEWDGEQISFSEFPVIKIWADSTFETEIAEVEEAQQLAKDLAEAAELLERILFATDP